MTLLIYYAGKEKARMTEILPIEQTENVSVSSTATRDQVSSEDIKYNIIAGSEVKITFSEAEEMAKHYSFRPMFCLQACKTTFKVSNNI